MSSSNLEMHAIQNCSNTNSQNKFTGATSISQLLKTSYAESNQTQPAQSNILNLSFPLTQEQRKQMSDDNYKFRKVSVKTRRNSALFDKQSKSVNNRRHSLQKSVSAGERQDQKTIDSVTDSVNDCKYKIVFFIVVVNFVTKF
jgi:hypothetical protein